MIGVAATTAGSPGVAAAVTSYRDIESLIGILVVIAGLLIIGLILFLIEQSWTSKKSDEGVVIEKFYSPEETEVGTGLVINPAGMPGMATVTSCKEDKYFVFVDCKNKKLKAETSMERFLELNKGDKVKVERHYGKIFNSYVGTYIP